MDGAVRGYALQTPWGAGPAVLATDADAGVDLLRGLAVEAQPVTVTVPDDNPAAIRALRSWGFQPVNTALKMRYGPPVDGVPACVFGLYNLFWG